MLAARRDHRDAALGQRGLEPVDLGRQLFGRRQRGALLGRLGQALVDLGGIALEPADRVLGRVQAVEQCGVDRGQTIACLARLVVIGRRGALLGAGRGFGGLGLGGLLLGGFPGRDRVGAGRVDGGDSAAEFDQARALGSAGSPRRSARRRAA